MAMRKVFRLFIILVLVATFIPAYSQLPGVEVAELTLSPERPGPNESVTAKITSYVTDLNLADISWSINGANATSGKGMKSFNFKTGAPGAKTTIEVMVITRDGLPIVKNITIYPAKVDLIFEAQSYTPPFYKGRAYFPYQGAAKVVAIPDFFDQSGKKIPNEQLIFNWTEKDRQIKDFSGLGKNTFNFRGEFLTRTDDISVEVSSIDRKMLATAKISIPPISPKVVFYEDHPEYGILFNRALIQTINLDKTEMRVAAVPYFFDGDLRDNSILRYDWNLNGIPTNNNTDTLTVRNSEGGSGTALISLQLSNTTNIFQFADNSVSVNFGSVNNSIFR